MSDFSWLNTVNHNYISFQNKLFFLKFTNFFFFVNEKFSEKWKFNLTRISCYSFYIDIPLLTRSQERQSISFLYYYCQCDLIKKSFNFLEFFCFIFKPVFFSFNILKYFTMVNMQTIDLILATKCPQAKFSFSHIFFRDFFLLCKTASAKIKTREKKKIKRFRQYLAGIFRSNRRYLDLWS